MSSSPMLYPSHPDSSNFSNPAHASVYHNYGVVNHPDAGFPAPPNPNDFSGRRAQPENGYNSHAQDPGMMYAVQTMVRRPILLGDILKCLGRQPPAMSSTSQYNPTMDRQLNNLHQENMRLRFENEHMKADAQTWK